MKSWIRVISLGVVAGLAVSAVADDDRNNRQRVFYTQLVGYNEVTSVSTPAKGAFYAVVNKEGTAFTYWLTYSDLTFDVSQSHIHFGQHHQNGGISVWLCQATAVAPAGAGDVPLCGGPRSGTVTGTIIGTEVIGPAAQGIAVGEFAELLAALRAGAAYANVHSGTAAIAASAPGVTPVTPAVPAVGFPGGEIRGQIN